MAAEMPAGVIAMMQYHLYFLDAKKRTIEVREMTCFDDAGANSSLAAFKHGRPLELWAGNRLVMRLPAEPTYLS